MMGVGTEIRLDGAGVVRLISKVEHQPSPDCRQVWHAELRGTDGSLRAAIVRAYSLRQGCEGEAAARVTAEVEAIREWERQRTDGVGSPQDGGDVHPVDVVGQYCDTPRLLGQGVHEGFTLVVLTEVKGEPVDDLRFSDLSLGSRFMIMTHLAHTLGTLHQHKRVHGGLHERNVLFARTAKAHLYRVGLVDFALSTVEGADRAGLHSRREGPPALHRDDAYAIPTRYTETCQLMRLTEHVAEDLLRPSDGLDCFEVRSLLVRVGKDPDYLQNACVSSPADWVADRLTELAQFLQTADGATAPSIADARLERAEALHMAAQASGRACDYELVWDVVDGLANGGEPYGRIAAARFGVRTRSRSEKPYLRDRVLRYLAMLCETHEAAASAMRSIEPNAAESLAIGLDGRKAAVRDVLAERKRASDPDEAIAATLAHLRRLPIPADKAQAPLPVVPPQPKVTPGFDDPARDELPQPGVADSALVAMLPKVALGVGVIALLLLIVVVLVLTRL